MDTEIKIDPEFEWVFDFFNVARTGTGYFSINCRLHRLILILKEFADLVRTDHEFDLEGGLPQIMRAIFYERRPLFVDHINGNGLDNRVQNLRWATPSQNNMNKSGLRGKTSRFKGVSKKAGGKFEAYIKADGVLHYLGRFDSEEEAAKAVDKAALVHHGIFAKLNFPGGEPDA